MWAVAFVRAGPPGLAIRSTGIKGPPLRTHNVDMGKFSGPELKQALDTLSGWTVLDGKLHKEYKFPDFIHAFGFMATAALAIEKMGHHPEWSNVYNRVTVDLTTHDAQGITSKDVDLAKLLDDTAKKLQ
jgi:4a-hydroxytetrahydrobiopterin dehydratase